MLPPITGLQAQLIPLEEFPRRRWFHASPLWYYHHPGPRIPVHPDADFYNLIDPHLRELCHLLHQSGIQTTPSCQGHFHPKSYFEKVWTQLLREQQLIQTEGLIVQDCEIAQVYHFQDPAYQLPWQTLTEFHAAIELSQTNGYLGILLPPARQSLAWQLKTDAYQTPYARIAPVAGLFFSITTTPPTPEQARQEWQKVTAYMSNLISHQQILKPAPSRVR